MIAPEGLHTGQFVFCGKKGMYVWTRYIVRTCVSAQFLLLAAVQVGNILPLSAMPEGTIICNVEEKTGDRGRLARTSGKLSHCGVAIS